MLDVAAASFTPADLDMKTLSQLLGIKQTDIAANLPTEVATADFIHLCLPLTGLDAMATLRPDFAGLSAFCVANQIETIAAFSTEVIAPGQDLHVRDFCPAVGVAESAAAGTTNAALAAYCLRYDLVTPDAQGGVIVQAEQGIELGRPSRVISRMTTDNGRIVRLQVGGVASRVLNGTLNVATV